MKQKLHILLVSLLWQPEMEVDKGAICTNHSTCKILKNHEHKLLPENLIGPTIRRDLKYFYPMYVDVVLKFNQL